MTCKRFFFFLRYAVPNLLHLRERVRPLLLARVLQLLPQPFHLRLHLKPVQKGLPTHSVSQEMASEAGPVLHQLLQDHFHLVQDGELQQPQCRGEHPDVAHSRHQRNPDEPEPRQREVQSRFEERNGSLLPAVIGALRQHRANWGPSSRFFLVHHQQLRWRGGSV